ncbi:peptidase A4 family-domain-containing protein [Phyllosticta citriasiana]|uniref:Peptidase A4 family-domain-containing protein n=1 Tax=Phyllosticta citriasiana TaxID=595635 RepID=A0ABR1KHL8_9PEZI
MLLTIVFVALLSFTTTVLGAVVQPRAAAFMNPSKAKPKGSSNPPKKVSTNNNIDFTPWVGAVIMKPPAGTLFTGVSAKLTVPNPRIPQGMPSGKEYGAAAWVGIDGATSDILFQTGINFHIDSKGVPQFNAWQQWLPGQVASSEIDGFAVHAGDVIYLSVTSPDGKAGTVIINNETTGQKLNHPITAPKDSILRGMNADWIVEQYGYTGEPLTPVANFGSLAFTEAKAMTEDGKVYGPQDGGELVSHATEIKGEIRPGSVMFTFTG